MVYQWKSARQIKADANEAAKVMNELADKNALTAENLVEVSRPDDAPLHNEFEWDNDKAAAEYRKHQARNIINALVVIPDEEIAVSEPVRAYFKVDSQGKNYTQLNAIIENPSKMEMLLKAALAELDTFKRKYSTLQQLSELMEVINKTIEECA